MQISYCSPGHGDKDRIYAFHQSIFVRNGQYRSLPETGYFEGMIYCYLATEGSKIIGTVCIYNDENLGCVQISKLAVLAEYQKNGVGSKLLKKAEDWAIRNGYSCALLGSPIDLVGLYRKRGYYLISVKPEISVDGVFYVPMAKKLR